MPLEEEYSDDEEQAALVSESITSSTSTAKESFVRRHWTWLSALVVACFVAVLVLGRQDSRIAVQDVTAKKPAGSKPKKNKSDSHCSATCQEHLVLLDSSLMLQKALQEKQAVLEKLQQDYGEEYFRKIFMTENGETVGKTAFASAGGSDVSYKRLVQKFMKKVLGVQMAVEEDLGDCDCSSTNTTKKQRRLDHKPYYQRFVWANGGHSASAAHGNYHNQSYTAVMEETASSVFRAVGIEFEGRNYAMGGMDSAPELALCNQAVYGMDPDIISWDFGMTDGRAYWKKLLYGNRAGLHPNRPALVEFGVMGRVAGPRIAILKELEEAGLTGMYQKYDLSEGGGLKGSLPDMATMTSQQIQETPKFVQHLRCGEGIETGDPTCGANKFTPTTCKIKGRVGWHPGWKAHALNGNIVALFMIETLIDAIKALDDDGSRDRKALFDKLKQEEDADYERFFQSNFTVDEGLVSKELATQVDASLLFRGPAMCHTAILPAKTRYMGIVTDTREASTYEIGLEKSQEASSYEIGLEQSVADKSEPSDTWQLSYDASQRISCPILEKLDFKDWFLVRHSDVNASLTIPNAAERQVYLGDDTTKLRGLVVMCFFKCDWGRCKPGTMSWEQVNDGNVTMSINGHHVEEMTPFGTCNFVRGQQGYYWEPNEKGQHTFTAQVHPPNSFMRISSIILL